MNVVLSAVCMGLGGGAYAGLLPARMGILPLFPFLSAALLYGGAWWIQRFPSHVSMPNQTAYDALSEEDQQKVNARMLPLFYWSVTPWIACGIVSFLFPAPAVVLVVALVLASIANVGMTIRFLSKANRKLSELQEARQDRPR
ncbi:hypothetical protein [Salinibacter altiplanensis]|uniref:hypothetical protein n=1 Tax=Salinibacter altiplanensis TaxID=1803181 RepID=UPI0012FFFABB|nr:hypothetical protein [Salinibacter altiplanensis]